jgi:hypothetical protein
MGELCRPEGPESSPLFLHYIIYLSIPSMTTEITDILKKIFGADAPIELSVPDEELFGHYSTNFALRAA